MCPVNPGWTQESPKTTVSIVEKKGTHHAWVFQPQNGLGVTKDMSGSLHSWGGETNGWLGKAEALLYVSIQKVVTI